MKLPVAFLFFKKRKERLFVKIEIHSQALLQNISIGGRFVESKTVLPILTGIKLTAETSNVIKSTSTNLEMAAECCTPAKVLEAGSVVIPAKQFTDIVKSLPQRIVSLDVQGNTATIRYGSSEINLNCFPSEEFPILPNDDANKKKIRIKENVLKEMLGHVLYATATDQSRPVFTGVFLEVKDNKLILVATDAHRLGLTETTLEDAVENISCIIPGKALSELGRIIGSGTDRYVTIDIKENNCVFSIDDNNINVIARFIEGQYPNYRQVLPAGSKTFLTVSGKSLMETVERVGLLAGKDRAIKMEINDTDEVSIDCRSDIGNAVEIIKAVSSTGEPLTIYFKPQYLIDGLRAIGTGSEEVTLSFNGPLSPVIIRMVNEVTPLALVLPVRASN